MTQSDWALEILDAAPDADMLVSLAVGDFDGDDHREVVTGGETGIVWYRPATYEQGVVDADARTMVGIEAEDVDGDGRDEVVASVYDDDAEGWRLEWFDPTDGLDGEWTRHVVDPQCKGGPHDICYADLDGDGEDELVVNAAFTETPGVFAYDRPADPTEEWERHPISTERFAEGLAVGDVDGDGEIEVVNGPDLFHRPADGAWSREWRAETVADSMRAFCRADFVDVTGDGTFDLVVSESEYPDSRLVWYENRGDAWVPHELVHGMYDLHSLTAWREGDTVRVFAAEMAEGGWGGHYRWKAEQFVFETTDGGDTWTRDLLARGAGTHEAAAADVDGDGVREYVGKEANHPVVHWVRRASDRSAVAEFEHRLIDRDKTYASTDVLAADVDGDGRPDVVTGKWWYRAPDWQRFEIPGLTQVHAAADLDGDGETELVGTTSGTSADPALSADLVLVDPVDPVAGEWTVHDVGEGSGDWIQGSALVPLDAEDPLSVVATYYGEDAPPAELFRIPDDPTDDWDRRTLGDVPSGQDLVTADFTGSGTTDVLVGGSLVENLGRGEFETHRVLPEGFEPASLAVGDLTGDGRPTVVAGEALEEFAGESLVRSNRAGFDPDDSRLQGPRDSLADLPLGHVAWFEHPGDPRDPWEKRVVDQIRHPRSVGVGDLDGDGIAEIVAGEHDPSWRYRSQSRLFAYERADDAGRAWRRHLLEDRFEHNAGAQVAALADDRPAVLSHGWSDSKYVHLVAPPREN